MTKFIMTQYEKVLKELNQLTEDWFMKRSSVAFHYYYDFVMSFDFAIVMLSGKCVIISIKSLLPVFMAYTFYIRNRNSVKNKKVYQMS